MAKVVLSLTLLSLLFAFTFARSPSDAAENDVVFLDLSNSRAEIEAKPTLLLPSERTIYEPNTAEETEDRKPFPFGNDALVAGEEGQQKPVEVENDGAEAEEEDRRRVEGENDEVVAEEEEQKPVEDENDGVVEAEQEDLERPLTSVRFLPANHHFRRPCHHWMKRMMRMRAMRHRMQGRQMPYGDDMMIRGGEGKVFDHEFFHGGERKEFRGDERREVEEEEQKPVEIENNGVVAAEEDQKATEPETQTLDLSRPLTVERFPLVNRHFRRPCRHHWMKHMMRMRHQMHGGHMLPGGERKVFNPEFFRGGERKEVDKEMGEFRGDGERMEIDTGMFRGDGERKEFASETFRGGERKEFDREMFRGVEGDHLRDMRPQWMGHHQHHYHRHHDHEGRPWFPFFGRHHHHDHERFERQSSRRPFFRREEGEEEREEGGFLDRIRNFVANHF
ncbi:uncharacterized protein LOC131316603 isoform X1 [Rhododendron vialii]|uniref:uncharacterized protein LOC131316603 isoform X1 n=1 Tax=Rhododendron vialii TaxID=182163 RepID=UPI00265E5D87|nr:uncharacterized protein LOC131316603 isoform X1 [Rhododendron vialii]